MMTKRVPEGGWTLRRFSEFCQRLDVRNGSGSDMIPLSVTKDCGIVRQDQKFKKRIAVSNTEKYLVIRRGEFAYDPMSLYYGAIGRLDCEEAGILSPAYIVFRIDRTVDPVFFSYFVKSAQAISEFNIRTEGGNQDGKRKKTDWDAFCDVSLLFPTLVEQQKIASYLQNVESVIASSRQVIKKACNVKRAILHKLLTTGIPGYHTQFKNSALGLIPEEWAVEPLEEVAVLQTGYAKNGKAKIINAVSVPYIRVANVQDGFLDLRELKTIEIERERVDRYCLQPGDVLFNEGGDADKLGRGCVWNGQISHCIHQNHVFAVRCKAKLNPQFLAMQAASERGKRYFMGSSKQTTNLASINSSQLKKFPVLVCCQEEQRQIIMNIREIDNRIIAERSYLAMLEHNQRILVSGFISGHIRVPVCQSENRKEAIRA